LYVQNICDIYAVLKDGECYPILDNVFLELVDDDDLVSSGGIILKTAPTKKPREGVIKFLSPFAESIGLKKGMRVMFPRSFRYEIKFFGKTYYKLEAEDIFAEVTV